MKVNMKKSVFVTVLRFVLKYILPVVIGYLEGDTKYVEDSLFSLF